MKNYSIPELVDAEGCLTCSICGKKFKPTDDTKYIANGGYTCDWKCFFNEARKHSSNKDAKERKKKR